MKTQLERGSVADAGCRTCAVYWGSHGCHLPYGHANNCECGCCECGDNHPHGDPDVLCVGRAPYYGPGTRFYGDDAAGRGLPLVEEDT